MKSALVIIIVLVGVFSCQLVHSEHQQRSINSSRSVDGASRNRETSGRMISSSGMKNGVHQSDSDEEDDDSDSSFDNEPHHVGDSSEITFPMDEYFPPPEQQQKKNETEQHAEEGTKQWKRIPSKALITFGAEPNVASFFQNYVKNTKVVKDDKTYEEYLAGPDGKPILDEKNEKVVVSPPRENEPALRFPYNGVQGRSGPIPETRTRLNVDFVKERQPKNSIALPSCTPEVSTVPVPLNALGVDPSMLVIPKCLKVERCGGCCLSDLTVCEADEVEKVKFTVTLLGYDGDSSGAHPQLQLVNTSTVEVEKHKSCKCKCKTKKEHCKSHLHKYEENQCSCVCQNEAAYNACVDNPGNRIWDHSTCQCTCQNTKTCSSGYDFDFKTCNCQPVHEIETRQSKRGFALNRTKETRG